MLMNVPPALLLLMFRNRIFSRMDGEKFWVAFSLFSLLLVPLFPIGSTLIDRVALYFIPLQIFVFSNVQYLSSNSLVRSSLVVFVISSYALVQFVWLNYACHREKGNFVSPLISCAALSAFFQTQMRPRFSAMAKAPSMT